MNDGYYKEENEKSIKKFFQNFLKKIKENNERKEKIKIADEYYQEGFRYTSEDGESIIDIFMKALQIYQEVYGEKHEIVKNVCRDLGFEYSMINDYNNAIDYYNKALNICQEIYGQNSFETVEIYDGLGTVYFWKEDYNMAIDYYNKALENFKAIYGENHFQVGEIYKEIGDVYSSKIDYNNAIVYYNKAVENYKTIYGDNHFEVGKIYYELGEIYFNKGNDEENETGYKDGGSDTEKNELDFYNKALKIFEINKEGNESDLMSVYSSLGNIHSRIEDLEKAEEFCQKAFDMANDLYGDNDKVTEIYKQSLDRVQKELQDKK